MENSLNRGREKGLIILQLSCGSSVGNEIYFNYFWNLPSDLEEAFHDRLRYLFPPHFSIHRLHRVFVKHARVHSRSVLKFALKKGATWESFQPSCRECCSDSLQEESWSKLGQVHCKGKPMTKEYFCFKVKSLEPQIKIVGISWNSFEW